MPQVPTPLSRSDELIVLSAINRGEAALRSLDPALVQGFRGTDGMGALCWVLRQFEHKSPASTQKMLQIALDHGAPIEGVDECAFTPLVFCLQLHGDQLKIAQWLLDRGANPNQTARNRVSPLEQLVHRMTQAGWRGNNKKRVKESYTLAQSLIDKGACLTGGSLHVETPLDTMVSRLRQVNEVKAAMGFMDIFWQAGHPWDDQWDEEFEFGGDKSWAFLPQHARQMIENGHAQRLSNETAPVGSGLKTRSLRL